jgi:starch phosphorylase
MEAAANGLLNPSMLGGWWPEGGVEGVTGRAIGAHRDDPDLRAADLYDRLMHVVLPLWHEDRARWRGSRKALVDRIGCRLNS